MEKLDMIIKYDFKDNVLFAQTKTRFFFNINGCE